MRLAAILTGLVLVAVSVQGQSDTIRSRSKGIDYFSYFGSGALLGKSGYGITSSFSTIHGIRMNSVAIGLGIGYDDYNRANLSDPMGYNYYMRWKSVPLFLSLSADWGRVRNNALFFQLNGGYSFIRPMKRKEMNIVDDSDGGVMINPSVGYRINAGKHRIYIGGGYKVQWNRYRYNPFPWIWGSPAPHISVKETLQRMEIRVGFGWN